MTMERRNRPSITPSGQVPVNESGFKKDARGEKVMNDYGTDEYAQYNAEEQRFDGRVAVD